MNKRNKGFTLIELMFVISIISIFAAVVLGTVTVAYAKGRDSKKRVEVASVNTAMQLYYNQNGTMPSNYDCATGTCVKAAGRTTVAYEDFLSPDSPTTESGKAYRRSMLDLVEAGYLSAVPHSPDNTSYSYYNYGAGTAMGAVFSTRFETGPNSTGGSGNDCRQSTTAGLCLTPTADFMYDSSGNVVLCSYGHNDPIAQTVCFSYFSCGYIIYLNGTKVYYSPVKTCSTNPSRDYCSCNIYY